MSKQSKKPQPPSHIESDLTQQEAEQRRDAILKRMLNTPPKPKSERKKKCS